MSFARRIRCALFTSEIPKAHLARSLSARREHTEAFPRFLYLCTDPARRIVKAGVSRHPETRLNGYRVGWRFGRRTYSASPFSVVWTHPLGEVLRRDAESVERRLHSALRVVAYVHHGEWYRMPASRAIDTARRFASRLASGAGS
jgi:hypothetical protein